MTSACNTIIHDDNLFTRICQYFSRNEMSSILESNLRKFVHVEELMPKYNTLLYGEIQSGKTSKLMRYIVYYRRTKTKILVIQNSLTMLEQYKNALNALKISFVVVDKFTKEKAYSKENVLIVLNNKHRMKYITMFVNKNKINNYSLMLDESDQYYNKIKTIQLYKMAFHRLHVTATPFVYATFPIFKNIVRIKPNDTYTGFDSVNVVNIPLLIGESTDSTPFDLKYDQSTQIVRQFVQEPNGMMLINWASTVYYMGYVCSHLAVIHPQVPILLLSTTVRIYHHGTVTYIKKIKSIQEIIASFNANSHVILVANRYSNRGFNYTNTAYTRFITHQLSYQNNSITNFIQKCRILGNRPPSPKRPTLFCMHDSANRFVYMDKIKHKITTLMETMTISMNGDNENETPLRLTKAMLVDICKKNNIKAYSKLNKQEILNLLLDHKINIYSTTPTSTSVQKRPREEEEEEEEEENNAEPTEDNAEPTEDNAEPTEDNAEPTEVISKRRRVTITFEEVDDNIEEVFLIDIPAITKRRKEEVDDNIEEVCLIDISGITKRRKVC